MARTLNRASQQYQPGTYGPFLIDSFTKADTEALRWTLTVEGWSSDPNLHLATVAVTWSNGQAASWQVYGGQPAATVTHEVSVPQQTDAAGAMQKVDVNGATIAVTVHVRVRTALTFGAV